MINKLWPKKKISWLFDVIGSGTTPSASNEMYYDSPDMAWLNTGDLTDSYIEKTSKYVSQQALDEFSALTVFPKDSLVMAMYGATIGKLGITKYVTTTNQACCVLSKPREVITKFIFYWLMGHRAEIINLSQGGGQPNISQGIIRDIRIAVPPVELQNKIVSFIDKKFEETNQLINKKEKMIKLLEQQRQSIITEAVIKGLNPNAKMKESGVEFIGEIPEHWEIRKIKEIANVYSSNVDKKSVDGEKEVLLCNYVDVYYNDSITADIDFMKATAKDEQIKTFTLKKHDVIITKDSESPTDIAIPTWVSQDLDCVVCGYHLSLIRCFENTLGHYLYYTLESVQIREQFYTRANGVTRFGLSKEAIKNGLIALPPFNEQLEIAEKLYVVNQEVRSTVEKVKIQIEKLKEYRQALIYEAVTGKIDVRDMELDLAR
jgi:type I restriction enzyme S subunit